MVKKLMYNVVQDRAAIFKFISYLGSKSSKSKEQSSSRRAQYDVDERALIDSFKRVLQTLNDIRILFNNSYVRENLLESYRASDDPESE